jgi:hypothetical protein
MRRSTAERFASFGSPSIGARTRGRGAVESEKSPRVRAPGIDATTAAAIVISVYRGLYYLSNLGAERHP